MESNYRLIFMQIDRLKSVNWYSSNLTDLVTKANTIKYLLKINKKDINHN